jgi:chromosome segregation ATPase
MSSITPPLDLIPTLPGKAASALMSRIDQQTDNLVIQVNKTIQDSIKLPSNIQCNDPRIQSIKAQLSEVQNQINSIQQNIPKIQQTVDNIKTAVQTAQAIKSIITVAQLSNPITAPVFIAMNLMAIQDALIVNSLGALQSFSTLPTTLTSKFQTITPVLSEALKNVASACNNVIDDISIPNVEGITDYNDLVDTEFYTEQNVSDSDLDLRSDTIQSLIEQQRNLITSLLEAPSQVYKQNGVPVNDLGKPGDYYVDLTTNKIYGPKTNVWPIPVN